MTIWAIRAYLAKLRFLEHESRHAGLNPSVTQRHESYIYALRMVESDTNNMSSPLTRRFPWLNDQYFPFLGYVHLCHHLRRRPLVALAQQTWDTMNKNHICWASQLTQNRPLLEAYAKLILWTWDV